MGSSVSRIYDDEREEQWKKDVEVLNKLAEEVAKGIRETNPNSIEHSDLLWFHENKAKIIRNKKLIDLIG